MELKRDSTNVHRIQPVKCSPEYCCVAESLKVFQCNVVFTGFNNNGIKLTKPCGFCDAAFFHNASNVSAVILMPTLSITR